MHRKPINELHLNLLGKVFFVAAAAWIVGKACNLKLRGTPEEMRVVHEALMSSRQFHNELNRPDASVNSIMECLTKKHAAAREFERTFDLPYPL